MRKIALCLAVLLSAVTVSTIARADGNVPAPAETSCEHSCTHVVFKRRIVGYRERYVPAHEARVPVYKHYRKVVHDHCCAPPPAEATVTPPPPKHITVEQKVFVRVVPRVIYVPARVHIAPPPCPPVAHVQPVQPCPPVGSLTDGGLRVRLANAHPPIAVPCEQMFHGRLVRGHCW